MLKLKVKVKTHKVGTFRIRKSVQKSLLLRYRGQDQELLEG